MSFGYITESNVAGLDDAVFLVFERLHTDFSGQPLLSS